MFYKMNIAYGLFQIKTNTKKMEHIRFSHCLVNILSVRLQRLHNPEYQGEI
jgi:hypothetical protein